MAPGPRRRVQRGDRGLEWSQEIWLLLLTLLWTRVTPDEITVLCRPLFAHLQKGTMGELGGCDPETLRDAPWSTGAAQAHDGQMGKKMDPSICLFVLSLCHRA